MAPPISGSSVRCRVVRREPGEEGTNCDIDLLVDMAEDRGFSDYLDLVEELEGALERRVDVVIARSLSPHFRPYILVEAEPL